MKRKMFLGNKNLYKLLFLGLLVLVNIFVLLKINSFESEYALKVVFLDVGQGDSAFIETSRGHQILIDGGPNDKVLKELSKEMSFFDKSIDVVIATHPDSDHVGGLVSVLERYHTDLYIESGSKSETLVYKSLENTLNKKNEERIIATRGMVLDLGQGVYLEILFPDRDVSLLETNMASIISRLEYGATSFLFTGDSPIAMERYVSSQFGPYLESDVLKAGHHGSKTSTSEVFLENVSPKISIISAGRDNRYGHPHKEVIERLGLHAVEILETSKLGSIKFLSDGINLVVK